MIPVEVIIAHRLSRKEKYNTLSKCVTSLWLEGGLLAFYRGAFPLFFAFSCVSLVRCIPFGIKLTINEPSPKRLIFILW